MLNLSPNLQMGLALGLTITGPVLVLFKMMDHEGMEAGNERRRRDAERAANSTGKDQTFYVNHNPDMNPNRIMNWWGVFALVTFIAGICLFIF